MAILSVVMLGLMISGVAYAEWTKMLYADIEIDTGYLHLSPMVDEWYTPHGYMPVWFDDHSTEVMYTKYFPAPFGIEKEWMIPYGWVEADVEANAFYITLENVYPCLTAKMMLGLYNDGSIPAGYNGAELVYFKENGVLTDPTGSYKIIADNDGGDGEMSFIVYDESSEWYPDYPVCEVKVTLTAEDCEYWPGNSWEQIDPGCEVWAELEIHFNEALPQDTEYAFKFVLWYVNWNEAGNVVTSYFS